MDRKTNKNSCVPSPVRKHCNADGIGETFLANRSSLKRFISQFINHPQDIEDIVHDAFLNSYAAEINTKIHKPKAFLFQTARNLAFKHLSKSSNRLTDYLGDFDLSEVLIEGSSMEDTAESHEQFAFFCKAVQKLPLQCRRAFILRKVYGLSHKEIAKHLNISVSTVEKHLATGITRCLDYMRAKGYTYRLDTVTSERKKR